jgi:hypothetical protein
VNTFRHSGKLGDIIYSLPAVRALGGGIFYVDPVTQYFEKPPLGKEAAQGMIELLETQDYIHRGALYQGQPVSCDLDRFRGHAVPVHFFNIFKTESDKMAAWLFGGIAKEIRQRVIPSLPVNIAQFHWEIAGLPGKADIDIPWITGICPQPRAEIVISKTVRHGGCLDWAGLQQYADRSIFVGLEEEWSVFRRAYFDVRFYQVRSLLEFAQVVAGAKLYVGNQSFGLALADAMLIPRVAELWESNPIRMSAIRGHQVLTPEIVEAYVHHD